jgi:hypothetical protein
MVVLADLPGLQLGMTNEDGRVITLDIDAAGWGWYTGTGAVPTGRIDLFSVLMHELGHLAGLDHTASGVMAASLSPGVRSATVPKSARTSVKKAKKPKKVSKKAKKHTAKTHRNA